MEIGGLVAHANKPEIAVDGIKEAEHVEQGDAYESSRRTRVSG
jgi:hypothetical protein